MPTPTPPRPDETPTDIYDRLRRIRRQRRATVLALAVAAVLASAGCTPAPADPVVASRVCGSVDTPIPTRVADELCTAANATTGTPVASPAGLVRWWAADVRCLDAGDYTEVGAPLNDDYLGEPCDPRPAPRVVTPSTPTTTPPAARPSTPPTSTPPATCKPSKKNCRSTR